ncbi:ricin-type beta-trefoil lectin domain protein [Streptomyces sp. NPDC085946]|uniref:RICIN domain-containing protein n=1 Tax=Streptomyces sp. NPDC085946 TaxID=3365744 RepID=UPI0037D04B44
MKDEGPPNSPAPARRFGATDEQLSAELRKWTGATPALQPVGELLDRHWEAGFAYARLCTDGPRPAGILTTAAFTRLFGETLRQNGPTAAWRPHLLVTVRRIAAEWDTEARRALLHPALRSGTGEGERPAARLLPPPERRLLSGAFQRLPQSARCLLWHTEVEAEPLAVPAGLLGLDAEGARTALGRARGRLREECLHLHRELAPDQECRRYLRLLDVTCRRGDVALDPDLRAHLEGCAHCRHGADQLDRFNQGLGLPLAEAVLGWGARDYVLSRASGTSDAGGPDTAGGGRPEDVAGLAEAARAESAGAALPGASPSGGATGEAFTGPGAPRPSAGAGRPPHPAAAPGPLPPGARTGTHAASGTGPATAPRGASRRSALRAARRAARRRNLTVGALTVGGLLVLPLVLWASGGSGDDTAPAGAGRPARTPGPGTASDDPSRIGSGDAARGALRGRLRNLASHLCVGIAGGRAAEGAEAELTTCSRAATQQWTYETDGLLRSAADPGLCLDSRLGHSVRLAPCADASRPESGDVRYDFTLRGVLVPRRDQDLALAPAATDGSGALVVKTRADGDAQRWVIDTSRADLKTEAVHRDVRATAPAPAPSTAGPGTPSVPPSAARSGTPAPRPAATGPSPAVTCASGSSCAGNGPDRPGGGHGDGHGDGHGGGHRR